MRVKRRPDHRRRRTVVGGAAAVAALNLLATPTAAIASPPAHVADRPPAHASAHRDATAEAAGAGRPDHAGARGDARSGKADRGGPGDRREGSDRGTSGDRGRSDDRATSGGRDEGGRSDDTKGPGSGTAAPSEPAAPPTDPTDGPTGTEGSAPPRERTPAIEDDTDDEVRSDEDREDGDATGDPTDPEDGGAADDGTDPDGAADDERTGSDGLVPQERNDDNLDGRSGPLRPLDPRLVDDYETDANLGGGLVPSDPSTGTDELTDPGAPAPSDAPTAPDAAPDGASDGPPVGTPEGAIGGGDDVPTSGGTPASVNDEPAVDPEDAGPASPVADPETDELELLAAATGVGPTPEAAAVLAEEAARAEIIAEVERTLSAVAAHRAAEATRTAVTELGGQVGSSLQRVREGVVSQLDTWSTSQAVPTRDYGIPFGLVALFCLYLVAVRWLDRGSLPMALGSEPRGDDVQHDL
jgi:hypothetical protein